MGGKRRQSLMTREERSKLGKKAAKIRLARQALKQVKLEKLNRQARAEARELEKLARREGVPDAMIKTALADFSDLAEDSEGTGTD